MAMTGVAVTATQGNLAGLLHLDLNLGDLGIFVCATSWAVYSLVLKRRAFEAIPTIASFFVIAAAGAVMLLPVMLYEMTTVGGFPMSQKAWASIAGLVIFSSVLSYSSYQYSVRTVGPSITSVFMYLMPAYGIVLAVLFLGESFRPYHAAGLALAVGGVVLATGSDILAGFARRRRSAP
jgi:drug/metabolite transporter (DMT)-like permease